MSGDPPLCVVVLPPCAVVLLRAEVSFRTCGELAMSFRSGRWSSLCSCPPPCAVVLHHVRSSTFLWRAGLCPSAAQGRWSSSACGHPPPRVVSWLCPSAQGRWPCST